MDQFQYVGDCHIHIKNSAQFSSISVDKEYGWLCRSVSRKALLPLLLQYEVYTMYALLAKTDMYNVQQISIKKMCDKNIILHLKISIDRAGQRENIFRLSASITRTKFGHVTCGMIGRPCPVNLISSDSIGEIQI